MNEQHLPKGKVEGTVQISGARSQVAVKVVLFNTIDGKEKLKGFIESTGYISIEPEHYSKNIEKGDRKWIKIEDYGRTLSGMRATAPANAPAAIPGKDAACLEYLLYLFSKDTAQVTLLLPQTC
ncbi:MAG: hypothetical protein Q8928_08740 [Bacteroidota bacterium]|nr:hypothetical protein [Bacteroidota bacterium]